MPVKKLPKKLVHRLQRASPKISEYLGSMRNIDHRMRSRKICYAPSQREIKKNPRNTENMLGRVRQMNVSRNFPKTELVIKRTHYPANWTIKELRDRVICHNLNFKPKNYKLLTPELYEISPMLVAMQKTSVPSIHEILFSKTPRGKKFFAELAEKHAVTKKQLLSAIYDVSLRTGLHGTNILLLGYKNKKFQFMPLADLE